jgi:hypothetical protein
MTGGVTIGSDIGITAQSCGDPNSLGPLYGTRALLRSAQCDAKRRHTVPSKCVDGALRQRNRSARIADCLGDKPRCDS